MDQTRLNWIANFIWNIADDCLRDVFQRGKYRDVMFYNTGIATYIWVLTNRKTPEREGKVQLIDASQWFRPLRKHLGKKNAERKLIQRAVSTRDENAEAVLVGKPAKPDATLSYDRERLYGQFLVGDDKPSVVTYEADTELRDTEQVPLQQRGGIEGFFRREVLPYASDAWIDPKSTKIGYEISFNRYFYQPQPLRSLTEIRGDILKLEEQGEGLLAEILGGGVNGG
ncbi:MAG: N-6 DNA methylase [Caldilineaceae bacterium]